MLFESSVAWVCDLTKESVSHIDTLRTRKRDPYASSICTAPCSKWVYLFQIFGIQ